MRFSRRWPWRMMSSGMSRLVDLVRTDVSEELSASVIRVTRICELGTTLAVTHLVFLRTVRPLLVRASVVPSSPILVTLMMESLSSPETSVLTRSIRRNIPEDAILLKFLYFKMSWRWWTKNWINWFSYLPPISVTQKTTTLPKMDIFPARMWGMAGAYSVGSTRKK
jgi:hypothetical protein